MLELSGVEELFVIHKISYDIVDVAYEVLKNTDLHLKFLFTDVKIGFVLDGESLDKLSSLINIIAHKRSTGFSSAPSASRLAPSCIHTCMRA
jgi:hypothetical protein